MQHKRGVPRGAARVEDSSFQPIPGYYPSTEQLLATLTAALEDVRAMLRTEQCLCGQTTSVWAQLKPATRQDGFALPHLPRRVEDPIATDEEPEEDEIELEAEFSRAATDAMDEALDNEGEELLPCVSSINPCKLTGSAARCPQSCMVQSWRMPQLQFGAQVIRPLVEQMYRCKPFVQHRCYQLGHETLTADRLSQAARCT